MIDICPLQVNDIPDCLHVVKANWGITIAQYAHIELNEAFSQAIFRPIFYVAKANGTVIGMACYAPNWADHGFYSLTWVNVHPEWHNKGIGRQLVNRCLDDLRAVAERVFLATRSPGYYSRHWGFKTIMEDVKAQRAFMVLSLT